jgi:hypothetical protein
MWVHVMPTLHTMSLLSSLVAAVLIAESIGRDEGEATLAKSVVHEFHSTVRGGGVYLGVIAERMLVMSGYVLSLLFFI